MNKISVFCIFLLLGLVYSLMKECRQGGNCVLPNCFCSTYKHEMDTFKIPQIVYFGFDDALTTVLPAYYDRLFKGPNKVNPNGCPIGMTLYVSHQYTSYPLVKRYYREGHEIAVHSVTHSHIKNATDLEREAGKQKRNIAKFARVPENEIIGWRSPFLETAGDAQAVVLKDLGYKYDISLTYKRSQMSSQNPFPFTLDFGWRFPCQITPCPVLSHKGFWEFPVNALMDYKNQYPCGYVDGCYNAPKTEEDSFQYLYKNFMSSYKGNRAPFGLHLHAGWFYTQFHLDAMDRFIRTILKNDDVYIVTTKKALDWMENPTPLDRLSELPSWSCENPQPVQKQTTQTYVPVRVPKPQIRPKWNKPNSQGTTLWRPTKPTRPLWKAPKPQLPVLQHKPRVPPPPKPTTTRKPWTTTPTTRRPRIQSNLPIWKPPAVKNFWSWIKPKSTTRKPTTRRPTTTTTTTTSTTTTTTTTVPTTTLAATTQPTTTVKIPIKQTSNNRQPVKPFIVTSQWLNSQQQAQTQQPQKNKEISKVLDRLSETPHMASTGVIEPAPPVHNHDHSPIHESETVSGFSTESCDQGITCKLPNCFCYGTKNPGDFKWGDTPQMVFLTFDGVVNSAVFRKYRQIIFKNRLNPNQCPIRSTFFVSQSGSSNQLIKRLYEDGNEIALKGYTGMPTSQVYAFEYDMQAQVRELQSLGIDIIQGYRSPNLKTLGDEQFHILDEYNFVYDSSITIPHKRKGPKQWPFTLDFNIEQECKNNKCPKKTYPGLWEVPNMPITDYLGLYPCKFVDGCTNSPSTSNDTYNFLWKEFVDHYTTNKAPLGLHFRQIWFTHPFFEKNLQGLERFLDNLRQLKDVYIVTVRDIIDWMKRPMPVNQLNLRSLWNC